MTSSREEVPRCSFPLWTTTLFVFRGGLFVDGWFDGLKGMRVRQGTWLWVEMVELEGRREGRSWGEEGNSIGLLLLRMRTRVVVTVLSVRMLMRMGRRVVRLMHRRGVVVVGSVGVGKRMTHLGRNERERREREVAKETLSSFSRYSPSKLSSKRTLLNSPDYEDSNTRFQS